MTDQLPTWTVQRLPNKTAASETLATGTAAASSSAAAAAAAVAADVPPAAVETAKSEEKSPKLLLMGAAALLVAGVIGFVALSGGGDASATAEETPEELPFDPDESASSTNTTTEEPSSDQTVSTDAEQGTETPIEEPATETTANAGESETGITASGSDSSADDLGGRQAIFANGQVTLQGAVPSQEVGDEVARRAGLVIGPDNVINNYVIDPSVEFDASEGTPLIIEDVVLFSASSVVVADEFKPLLDLGTILLEQNDAVSMEVIGHTDAAGDADANLALSQLRVDNVVAYWTNQGLDPSRFTAIGKGETEPVGDNSTAAGQQANRRVEFVIRGFLAD